MPLTEEQLIGILRDRAQEHWDAEHQPYLLSLVATDLRAQDHDYREAIAEEKLKTFVKRTGEAAGYTLVEHPTQRPKVGIVPSGVEFSFDAVEDTERTASAGGNRISTNERERVVLAFFRALGRLPEPLLEEINIPTKVLVKLLARK